MKKTTLFTTIVAVCLFVSSLFDIIEGCADSYDYVRVIGACGLIVFDIVANKRRVN